MCNLIHAKTYKYEGKHIENKIKLKNTWVWFRWKVIKYKIEGNTNFNCKQLELKIEQKSTPK